MNLIKSISIKMNMFYNFKKGKIQCILVVILSILSLISCNKNNTQEEDEIPDIIEDIEFIKGADLSFLPDIDNYNLEFFDRTSNADDMINILKNTGLNTVRIRIWKKPVNATSSFETVADFVEKIKSQGLKVWITLHYSDSWADPGKQNIPKDWENLNYNDLKDSVYSYTQNVVLQTQPDYVQIGNEINNGILWPIGSNPSNKNQFKNLLKSGIQAVREYSKKTLIVLHYAGFNDGTNFFRSIDDLDYDIIGISYYPWWHGKDLTNLKNQISSMRKNINKNVVIAEVSYPFTLDWNDLTNNIVGYDEHLILPDYPASQDGQFNFMNKIVEILNEAEGSGFCYWGAEWVAYKGKNATDGSSWENLALFDFDNKLVKAADVFNR